MDVYLYTPILVHYIDSVKLAGVAPGAPESNLRLEITSPSTKLPGYYQAYQRTWTLPIPASGILQLELLPSKYLNTPGHYRVKLYRFGNTIPEAVQSWEIPAIYRYEGMDLVRSSDVYDVLPPYVFAGVQVPGYEGWQIEAGKILWGAATNPPGLGIAYSLTYIQPLGLGDIVRVQ